MTFKLTPRPEGALTHIASPGESGLRFLRFSLLLLGHGQRYRFLGSEEERVLLLMRGECDVQAGEVRFGPLARPGVFEERATAVYVPPYLECSVEASKETEIAAISALADARSRPRLVLPVDVNVRHVGRSNWHREVHDVFGTLAGAQRLLVGETFNPPGNWSSFPPHRHERDDPPHESRHEEIYHFRFSPPSGFGLQRIYTDDGEVDESIAIRNGDTVVIPRGYHPVVAAPGYSLYYLWALAGASKQLATHTDPAHSWIQGNQSREPRG